MNKRKRTDFDFPQVDLPSKILAWNDITEDLLNLYKQACKLQAAVFAFCTKGSMRVTIDLIEYIVEEKDLITLFPDTIIQFNESIEPVQISFVGFSSDIVNQINLLLSTKSSYTKIIDHPIINIKGNMIQHVQDYLNLLSNITNDDTSKIDSKVIPHILSSLVIGVGSIYERQPYKTKVHNRQEEICRELFQLITVHYTKERTAQFYADKLGVTPQHLSTTVKQETGNTVLELIANVVIMDAKAKLKSTNLSIKDIASSLNFPSSSFFGKYFKRYVGMSPMAYKRK